MIKKFIVLPLAVATLALGTFGSASAQVASPRVALQFGTNGLTSPLVANADDATVARLLLDTTGSTEAVRISSLPFNLVLGGGADAADLMNCRVFNESANTVALNDSDDDDTLSAGVNNITFTSPMVLPANTLTTVALRCDIGDELTAGGTYTINMNTANVVATGATTGLPALVTIRGAVVVPPVVTPTPTTPTPTPTPGMPATGAGGEMAQNIAMLAASLLIAGLGVSSLNLRKKAN